MTKLHSDALARHSLNLLKGHMADQLARGQIMGGLSLNEFMLGRPSRNPAPRLPEPEPRAAEPPIAACSPASTEYGRKITGQAAECVGLLEERLARMLEIAAKPLESLAPGMPLTKEYHAVAAAVKELVESCELDGVKLLDGDCWAGDERFDFNPRSASGRFTPGPEHPGLELTLFDLSGFKRLFTAHDLDDPGTTALLLAQHAGRLEGIKTGYLARARLFESEAALRAEP